MHHQVGQLSLQRVINYVRTGARPLPVPRVHEQLAAKQLALLRSWPRRPVARTHTLRFSVLTSEPGAASSWYRPVALSSGFSSSSCPL